MGHTSGSALTTLCYIRRKDTGDILFIVKGRDGDPNNGKWLGIGGHIEKDESPFDCILREIYEETSLTSDRIKDLRLRGLITFLSDKYQTEYMHVFDAEVEDGSGVADSCDEGRLVWVSPDRIMDLPVWEGDRIMFDRLYGDDELFANKFRYEGEKLGEQARYK